MPTARIARHTTIVFAAGIVSIALGYGLRLAVARQLSVEEYGLLYAVLSFIYFFGILKDFGMATSIAKHVAQYYALGKIGHIKNIVLTTTAFQITVGLAVFAILFFGSEYFASGLFKSEIAQAVMMILAIEFVIGLPGLKSVLQGLHKFSAYSSSEIIRLSTIFLLVLFVLPPTAVGVATGYLIAAILSTVWQGVNVLRSVWSAKLEPGLYVFRGIAKFGLILFASALIGYVVSYTDVLALTYFRSLFEVGLYQAALPTSQVLWIFATALGTTLLPFIASLWVSKKIKEISSGASLLIRLAFATVIPFVLIFASYPEIILGILFGEQYAAGASALQVLSLGAIFYLMFSILGTTLMGIGQPGTYTKIASGIALLNLGINIAAVPVFGIVGAAASTALSYFVGFVLTARATRKSIMLSLPVRQLGKLFIGGLLALAAISIVKGFLVMEPVPEAVLTVTAGTSAYILYAFVTRSVTSKDLELLRSMGVPIPKAVIKAAGRLS